MIVLMGTKYNNVNKAVDARRVKLACEKIIESTDLWCVHRYFDLNLRQSSDISSFEKLGSKSI